MGLIMIHGTRRAAVAQMRYVAPVRPAAARDLVAEVYAQIERDFGMLAPPVSLHAAAPAPLAACWLMLRETLLVGGLSDRATREVVATSVSLANACPYCVDVHGITLHGLARGRDATAIVEGRPEAITDPGVREIASWARMSGLREITARRVAPFRADLAPELVGVAVVFHYINRMVNVFLTESPLPPGLPPVARSLATRAFARLLRPAARRSLVSGRSLGLLPAASLPDDLSWAAGHATIAQAFARAAAAIEAAAARQVSGPVRDLVAARLAEWDGRPPGPRRAWVDDAAAGLAGADRPAGRLALLIAMASYQVTPADIEDFRRDRPDDRTLVEFASWASLAAARAIGGWLRLGLPAANPPATVDSEGSAPQA